MGVRLPNGALLYLATAYNAADTVSAVTNANPAVMTTSAAHGISNGAFFEWTSGWSRANERVFRASGASGSTISPEGFNTTDTGIFAAGNGIGSIREISTWQQITQILDLQTQGGDQQFTQYEFLEDDAAKQLPTSTSPQGLTIQIADDPALAGYQALAAAAEARALRALKMTLPGGSLILFNGYVSFNETPRVTKGNIMAVTATFSLSGRPVRYAS